MFRVSVKHNDEKIDVPVDEKINPEKYFITATYRQLAIASSNVLTIYDLSSLLLSDRPEINHYETITTPHRILALTSTIDRIFYLYKSEKLVISSIPSGTCDEFQIDSFDENEPIHLCALDDGTVFIGYDRNVYSVSKTDRWSFESKIVQFCCGKEHLLVLLDDGRVFSWGNGLRGALGFGDLEPCPQPNQIESLERNVRNIAAGGWHSLALLNDGSVMSWGWNNDGSLGLGPSETDEDEEEEETFGVFADPTLVTRLPLGVDCRQISAGARHSAFVDTDDRLWLCGSNKQGQRGETKYVNIGKQTTVICSSWFTFLIDLTRKN